MKNCITCKYQPNWDYLKSNGVEFGFCRWDLQNDLKISSGCNLCPIIIYKKKLPENCPVWEPEFNKQQN